MLTGDAMAVLNKPGDHEKGKDIDFESVNQLDALVKFRRKLLGLF
jgi:hypothetical protein